MTETATEQEHHVLPVKSIRTSKDNPRAHPDNSHLDELTASVKAVGVIQPLVVRPSGKAFEVVAGERRLRAAKAAGLEEVPVVVREYSKQEAHEIRLVENLQREDLEPLEEAAAIQNLLDGGRSVAEVADRMGKTVRYVARRANLTSLTQQAATAAKKVKRPLEEWPAEALELLALFEPGQQAEVIKEIGHWRLKHDDDLLQHLEHEVETHLRQLKRAPFKIDDETLVPAAGVCTECPHQSARCPGLFEDTVPVDQPDEAVCRKPSCWEDKKAAMLELAAAGAVLKHEDRLICVRTDHGSNPVPKALGSMKALNQYDFNKAKKKSEKGARPAFVITGKQAGKVIWVKLKKGVTAPKPKAKPTTTRGKAQAKKPTPAVIAADIKEREEKLTRRRTVWIFDQILDRIETSSCPTHERLIAMVQIYGAEGCLDWQHSLADRKKILEEFSKTKVWHQVVAQIRKRLARHSSEINESNWKEALWLAREFLGLKEKDLRELAVENNPEPKVLQRLKASQEQAA